ncbi:hypothetical protein HanPI659440_Chr08g0291231 [Helianthus annuus]|nr:hypothetical protein HanPI659440_Chr08g0291231 [Helianthus annuus]
MIDECIFMWKNVIPRNLRNKDMSKAKAAFQVREPSMFHFHFFTYFHANRSL